MRLKTLWICIFLMSTYQPVLAKQIVRIGAYEFPPYMQIINGQPTGLTVELITKLNKIQSNFHFEIVITTPVRRYQEFKKGNFDAIFFEDAHWGWSQQNYAIDMSPIIATDSEVFIALKKYVNTQKWFENLNNKSIIGIVGYNYPFSRDEHAPENAKYKIITVDNYNISIDLVLNKRADTAIITRSYLSKYLKNNEHAKNKLIISERSAQVYEHRIFMRKEHTLDINILHGWIDKILKENNMLNFESGY